MAKKKKAVEAKVYADGFYTARLPDLEGEARFAELEVIDGLIISIDGFPELESLRLSVDAWIAVQGGGLSDAQNGNVIIGARKNEAHGQENAPESADTETEAGSNPDQETQTTDSIAKKKNIRKPVLRTLRFPLGPDQIEAKCTGIAKKSRARDELEASIASIKAEYKGRIEKLEQDIRHDLSCVEDRAEMREVLADEIHDFEAAMVRYDYDGLTYEQREMTPRERQMVIEGVL